MKRSGIYIASKARHGETWRALRSEGVPIVSTWIDESGPAEMADFGARWVRSIAEASSAAALVVYNEPGEEMKRALSEVGAALACGVPVFWVGETADPEGAEYSVVRHPGVTRCASVADAIETAGRAKPGARTADQADAAVALKLVSGSGIISQADTAACSPDFLAALLARPGWKLREQVEELVEGLAEAVLGNANPYACRGLSQVMTTCTLLPEHQGDHAADRLIITGNGFVSERTPFWVPVLPEKRLGRIEAAVRRAAERADVAQAKAHALGPEAEAVIGLLIADLDRCATLAMAALGASGFQDDHTVTFSAEAAKPALLAPQPDDGAGRASPAGDGGDVAEHRAAIVAVVKRNQASGAPESGWWPRVGSLYRTVQANLGGRFSAPAFTEALGALRLTGPQWVELEALAKGAQPTFGAARARVQNVLCSCGKELAEIGCDAGPTPGLCSITKAGRERLALGRGPR